MKRAFTLVELLVVVAMIAILMASVGSGVTQARKRAMISKATQDVKEITNAILGYQNYAPNRSLILEVKNDWQKTTEDNMGMILGRKQKEGGGTLPILYNAQIVRGAIRDPWGMEYEYLVRHRTSSSGSQATAPTFVTAPSLPNFYRLPDEERQ